MSGVGYRVDTRQTYFTDLETRAADTRPTEERFPRGSSRCDQARESRASYPAGSLEDRTFRVPEPVAQKQRDEYE